MSDMTFQGYDYEPCEECGSTRFTAITREMVGVSITGYEEDDGSYTVTERLPNRQGAERIERLECRECGHVVVDREAEVPIDE